MAILTDKKARSMKPGSVALAHGGVVGLTLVPGGETGHGKWQIRYTSPQTGKRRTKGLGGYPAVGIAEAGRLGQEVRDMVAEGIDPLCLPTRSAPEPEPVAPAIPTLAQACLAVHQAKLPGWKNARHGAQWINTLTQYVIPSLGEKPLPEITVADIAAVLTPIWTTKPETARRLRQRLGEVFGWARAHQYVDVSPVDVVVHLLPKQPRNRTHMPAMDWRILPSWIARHFADIPPYETTRPLLLFVILTGCRSGEARGATHAEINERNALWTIPGSRTKTGRPHQVPLARQALALLARQRGLHETLVFPSPTGKEACDMVLTSFLRRVNAPSTEPGRVATAHGFRSTIRDWCSENGVRKDLAERVLAHTVGSAVEAAYHRTALLEERRPLMQRWADYVLGEIH